MAEREGFGAFRSFHSLQVGHPHCKYDICHISNQCSLRILPKVYGLIVQDFSIS